MDAAHRFERAGATVTTVSVPLHTTLAIDCVNLVGSAMPRNSMGENWKGHYQIDMAEFYVKHLQDRAALFPPEMKMGLVMERMLDRTGDGLYYARAQNAALMVRAAYDKALEQVDVLVMPTVAARPPKLPPLNVDFAASLKLSDGAALNTPQFDVTGHPGLSLPCGKLDGLPIGMMIVGRIGGDATVLRAGHAFEQLAWQLFNWQYRPWALALICLSAGRSRRALNRHPSRRPLSGERNVCDKRGLMRPGCKSLALVVLLACLLILQPAAMGQSAPAAVVPDQDTTRYHALLTTYCFTCHSTRAKIGGLALDSLDLGTAADDARTWEKALRKLRGHLMPPPGNPQPPQKDVESFVAWMETTLDSHAKGPKAGYVPIQRLNRTEYAASVKALVGVDVKAKDVLPQDIQVGGFDNIAAALSVSPSFLGQYITAARHIANLAVGSPNRVSNVKYSIAANQNNDDPLPPGT